MKHAYLVGTDIGTSSTKTVVTDEYGTILGSATESYSILCPHNVWAEQWPDVWEDAAKRSIRRAVRKSGVDVRQIAGMCVSGLYGGSGIPLDKDMQAVRPCIIWMDRRTDDICAKLNGTLDKDRLFAISENGVDSYFGYTKILWIKENEPENWARTKLFLTPNQYIIYRLTGEVCIDRTSAANIGGIFDYEADSWSDEMLGAMGIPRDMLPQRILRPTEVAGHLTREAASELGLPGGIPVCAGCVDCLASTLSTGAIQNGQSVAVLATSLNWGLLHNQKPANPKYISMSYVTDDMQTRYTYGGISTAGALTKWFSEKFAVGALEPDDETMRLSFDDLDRGAGEVPAGCEGLIMLPYFMGERSPIWDAKARGAIVGLTMKHSAAHIYRSMLESVGFALRHVMEDYGLYNGGQSMPCKLVGGGTSSALWVQILADITGITMECMQTGVEAPVGDAFLAGVGTGVFDDFAQIQKWTHSYKVICPNWQAHEVYNDYFPVYKQLYLSMRNDMHSLADLAARNIGV